MGPGHMGLGHMGPGHMGPGRMGPGHMGPLACLATDWHPALDTKRVLVSVLM